MLRGREEADVAIVGGGLSGLTAAVWLSRAGLRVALAEAGGLGMGTTADCMGVVSIGGVSCAALLRQLGPSGAEAFFHTAATAFQTLQGWLEPLGSWKPQELCMVFPDGKDGLEKEWSAIKQLGLKADVQETVDVPAIRMQAAAQIPMETYLPLLIRLAAEQGVRIYEHSRVISMETHEIAAEFGSIRAPYLLVATGYPILNVPGWYFLWLVQREYAWKMLRGTALSQQVVMESEGASCMIPMHGGCRLLCRCGPVGSRGSLQQAEKLGRYMMETTGMQITGEWHFGTEVHTPDGIPLIGPYTPKTPNLFVAGGYGGRGILGSMIAAQAISSRILGLPAEGYEIYDGTRFWKQWKAPAAAAARHLGSMLFHPRAPHCPHMGCRLVLNPHTRLWECPCHGSCFDDIGHVLRAPAVKEAMLRNRK